MMTPRMVFRKALSLLGLILLVPLSQRALAQPAEMPFHQELRTLNSGLHALADTPGAVPALVLHESVQVEEAEWLRLRFGDWHLGQNSYLVLTAHEDGAQQRFDAQSLARWQGASAFFNGAAIDIKLYVAPGDQDVFFELREVMVGETVEAAGPPPESICDPVDNRVPSTDPAVGRIVPVGCTGWLVSNGAFLTAGHCVGSNLQTVQFNVPASGPNGTVNHPGPEDQYPIEPLVDIVASGGFGDDWGVFEAFANSNGDLPFSRQNAFYRMSRDSSPATLRITGFGVDGPAPNFGNPPPRNEDSQTHQTDFGISVGETVGGPTNAFWEYRVDTQGGNSGSPIIIEGTDVTVGIHTHGGCTSAGGANAGTSFENDDLEAAIQAFLGANVIYADPDHPITTEDGTVFRPFDTLLEAADAAAPGDVISLVGGSYDGETVVITKALTISTPTGPVVIGN